jgi:hypothetical protein
MYIPSVVNSVNYGHEVSSCITFHAEPRHLEFSI